MGGFLQGLNQGLNQQQQLQMQREQLANESKLANMRMKMFDLEMQKANQEMQKQAGLDALFRDTPAQPAGMGTAQGVERFGDPTGAGPFADWIVNLPQGAQPSPGGAVQYPTEAKPRVPSPIESMMPDMRPEALSLLKAAPQQVVPLLMNRMFPAPKDPVKVGEGDVLVDPTTGKQVFAGPPKEDKPLTTQIIDTADGGREAVAVFPTGPQSLGKLPRKPAGDPKAPLTVSDENRYAREMFGGRDYMTLTPPEAAQVNKRIHNERIQIAREQAVAKADVPTKPSSTEREKLAEGENTLASLDRLGQLYKPDFVGPMAGAKGTMREKFGGSLGIDPLSPEQSRFRAESAAFKNAIIKAITGSTMGQDEQKRILQQIPDDFDPPQTWEGKYQATVENMMKHADIFKGVLKDTGVDVSKVKPNTKPTLKESVAAPKKETKVTPPKNEAAMEFDRAEMKRKGMHPDVIEGYLERKYGKPN